MTHLVIHIGPPKTATTSLQVALGEPLPPNLAFLGAYQPRERNGKTRCHVLNDWVIGIEDNRSRRLIKFLNEVLENRRNGATSIVVEEVLLDSSQGMKWDRKLEELGKKVSSLGAIPAITLRDPVDGILSLQREFQATLGPIQKLSPTTFSKSHQAQVFNYRLLLKCLLSAGFDKVLIFPFHQMISFGLDLRQLASLKESTPSLKLSKHNSGGEKVRKNWLYERGLRHLRADYYLLLAVTSMSPHFAPFKIRDLLDDLGEPPKVNS